jgi:hypothetical protein
MKSLRALALIALFSLMAACTTAGSGRPNIVRGDVLAEYTFTEPGSFEQGAYGAATLRVNAGAYRIDVIQGDNTLWWGQWGDTYDNTVIEVDVAQMTERNENAYGVMCRVRGSVGQARTPDPTLAAIFEATPEPTPDAETTPEAEATAEATPEAEATAEATPEAEATAEATPEAVIANEGDGYLFLIQGTGAYGIFRARGRAVVPLINWTISESIRLGPASNQLRAVCVDDYLALYVNDVLLGEVRDGTYRSGQIGLVASAANRLGVRVEFDNLTIYQGRNG